MLQPIACKRQYSCCFSVHHVVLQCKSQSVRTARSIIHKTQYTQSHGYYSLLRRHWLFTCHWCLIKAVNRMSNHNNTSMSNYIPLLYYTDFTRFHGPRLRCYFIRILESSYHVRFEGSPFPGSSLAVLHSMRLHEGPCKGSSNKVGILRPFRPSLGGIEKMN